MAKVHIAIVGRDRNNIIKGVGMIGGTELYPIISKDFRSDALNDLEQGLPYCRVHKKVGKKDLIIDPFSDDAYQTIIELILDIYRVVQREGNELYINITGGTNLMSAAGMSGSLLSHATAYYVLERKNDFIKLPWHAYNVDKLNENDKEVIHYLSQKDGASDSLIANEIKEKYLDKPKKGVTVRGIRYSLKKLMSDGYIDQVREGRKNGNFLTIWGKIAEKLI